MEVLTDLLLEHLKSKNLNFESNLWRVQKSPLGGRGLFANREINQGEIIFIDQPLLLGPRSSQNIPLHCVVCSQNNVVICSQGCGLPVCSAHCEESTIHKSECKLIKNKKKTEDCTQISRDLFRSLVLIRGLFLNNKQRELLKNLLCAESQQNSGVDINKLNLNLSKDDADVIRTVSCILNSHGFEAKSDHDKNNTSLRGLYPVSALMNHNCVPNTMHLFDHEKRMIVKASIPIKTDCEILTTYTPVLWGTTARRHFLSKTKHFWCYCGRCGDPKEFGAGLSGLKCTSLNCQGTLYPLESLDSRSKWQCEKCGVIVGNNKIGLIQTALGNFLGTIKISNVQSLINFVKYQLEKIAPLRSQIAVEFKSKIIWLLGHTENYYWHELTMDHLNFKEELCKDLLKILTNLRLGQCRMRGLILMELHRCMVERSLRVAFTKNCKEIEDTQQEQRRILKEAADILRTDINITNDVNNLVNSTN